MPDRLLTQSAVCLRGRFGDEQVVVLERPTEDGACMPF
jgi:hypothetical protein